MQRNLQPAPLPLQAAPASATPATPATPAAPASCHPEEIEIEREREGKGGAGGSGERERERESKRTLLLTISGPDLDVGVPNAHEAAAEAGVTAAVKPVKQRAHGKMLARQIQVRVTPMAYVQGRRHTA